MNLERAEKEIIEFKQRIAQCLQLQPDQEHFIATQRLICNWLKNQTLKVRNQLDQERKKNTGIIGGIRKLGLMKAQKDIGQIELYGEELKNLHKYIDKKMIPSKFQFKSKNTPPQIIEAIQKIKDKKWIHYYAYIKAPFLTGRYISKKQHFHNKIEDINHNGLKLVMIEEKVAHKYQRNLVQQIFGRVLRPKGSLTMVLKIQVGDAPMQDPYYLYCYVEDLKFKKDIQWRSIDQLQIDQNDLCIKQNGKKLITHEQNILEIMLSQILILPVQSIVSNFIIQMHEDYIEIVKCSEQDQNLIIKQQGIQEHPALRNPLLYFTSSSSPVSKSAKISNIQSIINSVDLYSSFYKALNLMVNLIIEDFSTETIAEQTIYSSLCFNFKAFQSLWNAFHKIVGLKGWLNQVILPIKQTISTAEIFNHFCPIFNQLCVSRIENIKENRQFFLNVQIQSYLTTFIKKKTLQKYKNMYVNIEQANLLSTLNTAKQVYDEIFKPILQEVDLQYVNPIEAVYILDFVCKHKFQYKPNSEQLPFNWKDKQVWKRCIKCLKQNRLKFVDISFDIVAYTYGFDTLDADPDAFERIKYFQQNQASLIAIQEFVLMIREKWPEYILSSLLEKAFKHKKYELCKKLLQNNVRIRDFKDTFTFQEIINPKFQQLKDRILKKIKEDSPQMHRIFKWQQLFFVQLQQSGVQIQTLDFGKCLIPGEIISMNLKEGKIVNNLSRNDHKFDPNREIVKIDTDYCKQFYIQKLSHPLLNYFYKIFYQELGIPEILPYFTTFFHENKLFTIIQHIPDAFNYEKGIMNFSEQELNIMGDQKLMSESIISTLTLLPRQVRLKDIIISPSKSMKDQLFIIDLHCFYNKAFLSKSGNITSLSCRNSLFLFDVMHKQVHPDIIKKYAELDVIKFVGNCFEEYSNIIQAVSQMRKRNCDASVPNQQFLGLVFQNGFILNLTQRLFKIKRLFRKKGNQKKCISYMKVLEILNPQMHDFYNEIMQIDNNLVKRQKTLLNQNWKKSFVNSCNLVQFFGSFCHLDQDENTFPDHYYKYCFNGPSESLTSLTTNLKRYNAFSNSVPDDLELYSNQFFEYYIKNVDISQSDSSLKQKLLEIIKNKSKKYLENPEKKLLPLSYIRVKGIQNMKQKYIHSFSYERVLQLVLEDCKIGDYDINNMPASIENIIYLQLKGIRSLKYIGENVLFGQAIQIKHLKALSIIDCEELIGIDLKCDILESMQLKNNPILENVYMHSNFLQNIYCSHNPKINLQNIGMYILKGINVLMCKTACRGDVMKLYSDTYDKYIVKLLKFLTSRFFNTEARYYMVLTLSRIQQVDDNLFAMSGITSFKGFSTMFNKFSTDVQDKILKSIFKLFFDNPYLKSLSTNLLTSYVGHSSIHPPLTNQVMSTQRTLRLMSEQLQVRPNNSQFNQILIQRPKSIFTNPNNYQYFMSILEALHLDKSLNICIQNLQIQDPNSKSQNQIKNELKAEKDRITQVQMTTSPKKQKQKTSQQKELQQVLLVVWYLASKKKNMKQLNLFIKNSLLNKTLFNQLFKNQLSPSLQQSLGKSMQKSASFNQNSMKKIEEVASKYREGFKKIIDKKMLKKQTSIISDDAQAPQQEKGKLCIRKIQINNSVFYQTSESMENIQVDDNYEDIQGNYNSIKQLKLDNCQLYSLHFFSHMPKLTNLSINNITIGQSKDDEILFQILVNKKLQTLQLSNYFKNNHKNDNKFSRFCELLKKMKHIKTLSLNSNELTLDNLKQLGRILNATQIKQLSMLEITLLESQEQMIVQTYAKFLQETQKLKSLTIQFQKQSHLSAFILSLSENESLVEINLQANHEISSKTLQPLRNNNTLSFIRCNMNLPIWLLTHIKSNTNTTYRKSQAFNINGSIQNDDSEDVMIENTANNNVMDMLNTSSGGSRLADFHRIGLSLDGGGMRGMLLATQLQYLAKQVGQPLHKIFDCIGGTSIGGILSLAATGTNDGYHPVCDTDQLVQIFTKYGKQIFKKSQMRQFRNLFDTKYSPASFQGVLKNYFKDCKLSDVIVDTNVVVTAVNRMDNKDYIFRSRQALLDRQRDFYMRDVARATAAAPTYFPSAEIKNMNATIKLSLLDGGMGMNNPSKLVIDEIKKISANSGNNENYFLLSLGTGRLPSQTIPQYAGLKDLSPIIDSFTESANYFTQRDLGDHYKGHYLRVSPLINIHNKKEGEFDNTSDEIVKLYKQTGIDSAKKFFKNTVIFGKYRNMNLIQWLQENTARKYDV